MKLMGDAIALKSFEPGDEDLRSIRSSLNHIQQELLKELSFKQEIIHAQKQEIEQFKAIVAAKDSLLEELKQKLREIEKNTEGNKQLNQKLINELLRKQQDIEWYKRTYESRSLLGTLKEKVFGGGHKK